MITITKDFRWDSAHRVLRHESKCASLHGHSYLARLTVTAPRLDSLGRVIDFSVLKEKVGTWIDDTWDHTTLVNCDDHDLLSWCNAQVAKGNRKPYVFMCEPTAENIALELAKHARRLLVGTEVSMHSVVIYETPTSSACYTVASPSKDDGR